MISNKKMRAEKCGELKLKTDFLATFGQHCLVATQMKAASGRRTSAFDGSTVYLNVQEGPSQPAVVRCYTVN